MPELTQDQLVRKEAALGAVRERPIDESFIFPRLCPFLAVQSDDVTFQYIAPEVTTLAPARAEDAESELARKDDTAGYGRASLLDWAIKDHYVASDVSRFREYQRVAELQGADNFPLTVRSMTEDWANKVARDSARRRRSLDARLEWLFTQALSTNTITYDDGKIKFTVTYGRPAGQENQAPASGVNWDDAQGDHDPIGDLVAIKNTMRDTYDIEMGSVIMSVAAVEKIVDSKYFANRMGFAGVVTDTSGAGTANTYPNPWYGINGWGIDAARAIFQSQIGLELIVYDSKYRTRALGSTTFGSTRYIDESFVIVLPRADEVNEISDTEIGFAKMLTSPHPEGNWSSGFYAWERDTVDPWGVDMGTGIKAFPVLPHLDLTYVMNAW